MVLDDGYAWNGCVYRSLSQVAKAITGTNWNGHRFFGLKAVRNGAPNRKRRVQPLDGADDGFRALLTAPARDQTTVAPFPARRKCQQGRLLAVAAREMHTDRQAIRRPMQRHAHRRRARRVVAPSGL